MPPSRECRLADGGQLGRRCSVADNAVLQPMLQPPEIRWSHRFADVLMQTEDGRLPIDYRRFHNTEPIKPQ